MPTRTLVAAFSLAGALYAGARPLGPLPPLGPLLDPSSGVWAAGRAPARAAGGEVPGLTAAVEVRYDRRAVPHIFASSEADAYRALGYVVARDRLFQLDVQTRAATGELAGLVGARAAALDREPRRLGMPRAAERKLAALGAADPTRRLLEAYAAGVNAWIDGLTPATRPLEYKLLGARPRRWEPINSLHLFNRMGYTLASAEPEFTRLRAAAMVGQAAAASIFPTTTPIQQPIQPSGAGGAPRLVAAPLAPPGAPDAAAGELATLLGGAGPDGTGEDAEPRAFASNNWAVAPGRTAAGYALLAGDPHLALSLPSIWYEAHLVVPGVLDVYGVTIPGAPGIVIGFNRDVAWTFTNTSADARDFYRETVDDDARPARYRLDGAWRPLERRVERYHGPRGELLEVDTVYYTHRGPLRRGAGGRWLSMRWTLLEPEGGETAAFAEAARSRTAVDFQRAMAAGFFAPAQNMLAADRGGAIAIRSTGRFPLRPGDGSGLVVRDGTTRASDWTGFWPVSRYPQAVSPAQGYLASANQQPLDPATDSTYFGLDTQFDPWRAVRINALLRADSAATPDAMRRYQTDRGSARADRFVPAFLRAAAAARRQGGGGPALDSAARLLAVWDRRYALDDRGAVLFEAAMRALVRGAWDELAPARGAALAATPSSAMLARLLDDSASVWWDDRATPARETRDEIVAASLLAGYRGAVAEHGPAGGDRWRWRAVRQTNIHHLLRIPAFSALGVAPQGGTATLSPTDRDGTHGASWRMVVELGPELRAWGIYPGGQSGDPASPEYTSRLPRWAAGALDPLVVPRDAAALGDAATARRLTLRPPGGP